MTRNVSALDGESGVSNEGIRLGAFGLPVPEQ